MYTCIMPLDARHRWQVWNVQVLFNYQKKKKLGKKKKKRQIHLHLLRFGLILTKFKTF